MGSLVSFAFYERTCIFGSKLNQQLRPDYPKKIFTDERCGYAFLLQALAENAAPSH
jgi:hypothetical protein